MPVSRPAVSQHLKALKVAGLVIDAPQGAARLYRLNPEGLAELRIWLESFWDEALANFKRDAEGDEENLPWPMAWVRLKDEYLAA